MFSERERGERGDRHREEETGRETERERGRKSKRDRGREKGDRERGRENERARERERDTHTQRNISVMLLVAILRPLFQRTTLQESLCLITGFAKISCHTMATEDLSDTPLCFCL